MSAVNIPLNTVLFWVLFLLCTNYLTIKWALYERRKRRSAEIERIVSLNWADDATSSHNASVYVMIIIMTTMFVMLMWLAL